MVSKGRCSDARDEVSRAFLRARPACRDAARVSFVCCMLYYWRLYDERVINRLRTTARAVGRASDPGRRGCPFAQGRICAHTHKNARPACRRSPTTRHADTIHARAFAYVVPRRRANAPERGPVTPEKAQHRDPRGVVPSRVALRQQRGSATSASPDRVVADTSQHFIGDRERSRAATAKGWPPRAHNACRRSAGAPQHARARPAAAQRGHRNRRAQQQQVACS